MTAVYCINLERRKDKWTAMERQSKGLGVPIVRIDAIDARETSNLTSIQKLKHVGPIGILSKGTRACTLSHSLAWQKFLNTEAPFAVFVEDDIVFTHSFKEFFQTTRSLPHGCDVLKLHGLAPGEKHLVVKSKSTFKSGDGFRYSEILSFSPGAYGYALSRRGAEVALEGMASIAIPVDHFLFNPSAARHHIGIKAFDIDPPVLRLNTEFASDLSGHRSEGSRFAMHLKRSVFEGRNLIKATTALALGIGRISR